MSDNPWDTNDDYNPNGSDGSALRRQLEDALKKVKAAETRAAEAEAKLGERSATEFLSAKGYKPGIAKFAAKDGVDVSDEAALSKWLEENADLFPAPSAENADQQVQPPADPAAQVTPQDDPAAVEFNRVTHDLRSQAEPAFLNKYESVKQSLPDNATPEQVRNAFQAAGL